MREVADHFKEEVSTIRFWCNEFDEFLDLKRNAKGNRQFRQEDFDLMEQIYYLLRTKKMKLVGAKNYLKNQKQILEKDIKLLNNLKNIRKELIQVKNSIDNG